VVATPRVFGSEDANIRRKMHTAVTVARSELNIGDAVIVRWTPFVTQLEPLAKV